MLLFLKCYGCGILIVLVRFRVRFINQCRYGRWRMIRYLDSRGRRRKGLDWIALYRSSNLQYAGFDRFRSSVVRWPILVLNIVSCIVTPTTRRQTFRSITFVDLLLFVAASALAALVSVDHLDSSTVYACNSDVLLRVFVSDRCFVERELVVPVRHCSCPILSPLHEHAENVPARFSKDRQIEKRIDLLMEKAKIFFRSYLSIIRLRQSSGELCFSFPRKVFEKKIVIVGPQTNERANHRYLPDLIGHCNEYWVHPFLLELDSERFPPDSIHRSNNDSRRLFELYRRSRSCCGSMLGWKCSTGIVNVRMSDYEFDSRRYREREEES